ncbi:Mov34/MPN/PAD-1 family protein [Hyphomicrobium sp.]|uniref:Mov34/MPN/PAD-1 family protein n=1 Tax=Hyphomicrobium sp. TaxID=82 RepID=UPI002FE11310
MPFLEPGHVLYLEAPPIEASFSSEVLQHFQKNKQDAFWKSEAGGQLFARINGKSWEIIKATGPRRSDYRRRFHFFPSRKDDQAEINISFSDGLHYVGDWHTHPEDSPTPSSLDLSSMVDLVKSSKHQLPGFLMVIVGTIDTQDGLWVSFHARDGSTERLVFRN